MEATLPPPSLEAVASNLNACAAVCAVNAADGHGSGVTARSIGSSPTRIAGRALFVVTSIGVTCEEPVSLHVALTWESALTAA